MSGSRVKVVLVRPGPGPWGLRLQGGADFEKALVISHVAEGGHSAASGLKVSTEMSTKFRESYAEETLTWAFS